MRTRATAMLTLTALLALPGCQGTPLAMNSDEPGTMELTILRPGGVSPGPIDTMWRTRSSAAWTGELDASAPSKAPVFILRQGTQSDGLNTATTNAVTARDLTLGVSLKIENGTTAGAGGGLVWRYRDDRNCYFCSVSPQAGELALYVTRDGVPRRLARTSVPIDAAAWHTLVVKHTGNRIICTLDEDIVIAAEDDSLPAPGGVGLWAAGDGAARFTSIRATTRN